jgi:hypothetical protein
VQTWPTPNLREATLGNGLIEQRIYNSANRLAEWDLLTRKRDRIASSGPIRYGPIGDPLSGEDLDLTYDHHQRLSAVHGPAGLFQYVYQSGDRVRIGADEGIYDGHQLQTLHLGASPRPATFSYDENGALVSAPPENASSVSRISPTMRSVASPG